jgi:hypothetical protein
MSAHDNLYTRCILMAVPPKDMNAYIDGKLDFVGLDFSKQQKTREGFIVRPAATLRHRDGARRRSETLDSR